MTAGNEHVLAHVDGDDIVLLVLATQAYVGMTSGDQAAYIEADDEFDRRGGVDAINAALARLDLALELGERTS